MLGFVARFLRARAVLPGRLPLFLGACVRGAVTGGLLRRGWDGVRAGDLSGEGAKDPAVRARGLARPRGKE